VVSLNLAHPVCPHGHMLAAASSGKRELT